MNILIVGAGVIGLSIARALSEEFEDVVVVEKEESFGRHTSSRNSEVIHSGIYYPQNTLKAKLCVRGIELIYDFCEKNGVPFQNCGKLIVASNEEELTELYKLKENGEKNNVKGLEIIDEIECRELEPQIRVIKALKVNSTGIFDTHKFMQKLEKEAESNDAFIVYDMEVISIKKNENKYIVNFTNGEIFEVNTLINSAGLFSDKIAEMVGIDMQNANLQLHWCKGEYYKTTKVKDIKRLIYPLPDPKGISLGIHLTINLNEEARFGPNAYYVNELNYSMDETHKDAFYDSIIKYIKIDKEHLSLDDCGIRPKLQGPDDDFRDFYIKEESEKGFPNFINLIGIDSPGLTCSLAIAEEVKRILNRK
ncbi:MAG: NAD(P)/FAD-dependent oxidoreductase [Candidatus Cloacimonetes bacterium]|nr:NAD(P)/FAD-dependent oxidoreductase [Candidatus Cloacimonadota bacterium]